MSGGASAASPASLPSALPATDIVTMIMWIRTSELSIKNFLSGQARTSGRRSTTRARLACHLVRRVNQISSPPLILPYSIIMDRRVFNHYGQARTLGCRSTTRARLSSRLVRRSNPITSPEVIDPYSI